MLEVRQWDCAQWEAVRDAFAQHFKKSAVAGNPLARHVSWDVGWNALKGGEVQAVITDGYLIVYDVGTAWYSTDLMLFEQMVLRLGPKPGNYKSVLRAFERLADQHGCNAIVTGNAVGRHGLTRAYEQSGYAVVATRFYKGIF